jgi:hypothetical protein
LDRDKAVEKWWCGGWDAVEISEKLVKCDTVEKVYVVFLSWVHFLSPFNYLLFSLPLD